MSLSTYWHIMRGSNGQIANNIGDTASALFQAQTYKSIWGLGTGLINGNISINQLVSVMGEELSAPFIYLYENTDHVFNGKPTKAEAFEYGQNYADALSVFYSFVGTAAAVGKLILRAPGVISAIGVSSIIKAVPRLETLAATAIKNDRPIIGILRSDGTVDAYVQPFNYGEFIGHNQLGLRKEDLGFGLSYVDGKWYVRGSGYAAGNNWAQPTPEQAEMIKKLFGVGE